MLSCLTAGLSQAAETVASGPATARSGTLGVTTLEVTTLGVTTYKTVRVRGVNIFYRQAAPSKAPAILLLPGFPSSSRMFDRLMPLPADRDHLIAPDYPGFGNSQAPSPDEFSYTFDSIADIVSALTEAIHLDRYALYLQSDGGPVGYRVAVTHPE